MWRRGRDWDGTRPAIPKKAGVLSNSGKVHREAHISYSARGSGAKGAMQLGRSDQGTERGRRAAAHGDGMPRKPVVSRSVRA